MSNLSIRLANKNDINFIYKSLKDLAEEIGVIHRFVATEESVKKMFANNDLNAFIAVYNQELAGLAVFSPIICNYDLYDTPALYIHDLYVLPEFRRHQIATFIKDELKKYALEKNFSRIELVVSKPNIKANKLYDSWPELINTDHLRIVRIDPKL